MLSLKSLKILAINLEEFRRRRAAKIIQKHYRDYISRKEAEDRLRSNAAIIIQKNWRRFILQRLYSRLKLATITIQDWNLNHRQCSRLKWGFQEFTLVKLL